MTETEAGVSRRLVATLPPTHSSLATTELASSSAAALALTIMGARRNASSLAVVSCARLLRGTAASGAQHRTAPVVRCQGVRGGTSRVLLSARLYRYA